MFISLAAFLDDNDSHFQAVSSHVSKGIDTKRVQITPTSTHKLLHWAIRMPRRAGKREPNQACVPTCSQKGRTILRHFWAPRPLWASFRPIIVWEGIWIYRVYIYICHITSINPGVPRTVLEILDLILMLVKRIRTKLLVNSPFWTAVICNKNPGKNNLNSRMSYCSSTSSWFTHSSQTLGM